MTTSSPRGTPTGAIGPLALLPDQRTVRRADALVAVGGSVVAALGAVVGLELARLAPLGTGLADAAAALGNAGRALQTLSGVPLVGSQVAELSAGVVTTAADVRAAAAQAAVAVRVLAVVIGVAVAFVSVPVLMAYLWFRSCRASALRELRHRVTAPDDVDPALLGVLAHRAVLCLSYARLRSITTDPWEDLTSGRHLALAAAELERLGLVPPREWAARSAAVRPSGPAAVVADEREQRGYRQ